MIKRAFLIVILVFILLTTAACSERRYASFTRVYAADKGTQETFYDATNNRILRENVWVIQPDGTFSARLTLDGETVDWAGQYDAHTQGRDFVIAVDTNGDGQYEETLYVNGDVSVEWRRPAGTLTYYLSLPEEATSG